MRRRATLLAILGATLAVVQTGCDANRGVRVPVIAVLSPQKSTEPASLQREPFERGLRELGWVPGKTVMVDYRYAEGDMARLAELADEVVKLKPNVIVARSTRGIRAAQRATSDIPIVMAAAVDPVRSRIVQSLAHPGGNMTGIAVGDPWVKQVDLIRSLVPGLARLAVLTNPGLGVDQDDAFFEVLNAYIRPLGIEVQRFEARGVDEIDRAFHAIRAARVDALIVRADPLVLEANASKIVALVNAQRLPAIYPWRAYVEVGGLMFYAPAGSQSEFHYRSAYYVDKILRGAKPADLAIEQPVRFDFVVNLNTARELKLVVPSGIQMQATGFVQ